MGSAKDSHSDASEHSTSYFNASFFPESTAYLTDDVQNYDPFTQLDEGLISALGPPPSYDALRQSARGGPPSSQSLILGSTASQYQPYYPTTEEVPITAGLGADLIDWRLCGRESSRSSGTRSQTSDQRSTRSKTGQTPPTVCETVTVVNGGQPEYDIDLDMASKENFDHLRRFNKQKSIMEHVDIKIPQSPQIQVDDNLGPAQFPSLASTKAFFPAWEIEAYHHNSIDRGTLDGMRMHFEVDVDSTISKSQAPSSIFSSGNRKHAGTAHSVTSFTDSSIAESAISERFNPHFGQAMPSYSLYNDEDCYRYSPEYSPADYSSISMVPPNLQHALDTVLENVEASLNSSHSSLSPSFSPYPQPSPSKRIQSFSPSPPPPKRRTKKEHVCSVCNSSFTEKTNLTRHIKSRKCTKGGPDMFSCPVIGCPRTYEGRSDNLKAHMKRVHRKEWNNLKGFQGDWRDTASLQHSLCVAA
ncbi:hypothetical protein DRE_00873 [Drechslerella stenobrocha 248]|uniref:C2H2-type domain-containing protein n=1 Tax=Drechslerella stenobrocha 248 TaxID=1043628 RepID=W7HQR9_9PEZI|nr:hypothetical protein DRE_00873 [Drechslerella stenobrocha 248]